MSSKQNLWDICQEFVNDNDISVPEDVYQSDRVIENAYEFIHNICDIVGYKKVDEDDDEE